MTTIAHCCVNGRFDDIVELIQEEEGFFLRKTGLPNLRVPASGKHLGQPVGVCYNRHGLVVYYTDRSVFSVRKGGFA